MFNANQIFRDPAWRRDDPDGALLINSADLGELGASDGDWIAIESAVGRLIVRCKIDDSMRNGQLALPHGYGQSYPAPDGDVPHERTSDQPAHRERQSRSHRRHALSQARRRSPFARAGSTRRQRARCSLNAFTQVRRRDDDRWRSALRVRRVLSLAERYRGRDTAAMLRRTDCGIGKGQKIPSALQMQKRGRRTAVRRYTA